MQLSGRAIAWHTQDCGFNTQYWKKKKKEKEKSSQASVVHGCILAAQDAEIRGLWFKVGPRQIDPISEKKKKQPITKKELVE
jgi:hypothetical protein